MILVTGCSQNHVKTLEQFLDNIRLVNMNQDAEKVIIYDLGIEKKYLERLQNKFTDSYFLFRKFKYENYPDWYNININAGEYAWKPAIIKECSLEYKEDILVWMDSGNLFKNLNSLKDLSNVIEYEGLHTVQTGGKINDWTHKKTIEYLNVKNVNENNRNGACIGFNLKKQWVKDFLTEYTELCSIKDCIAPKGSTRANHRQDQAILTILFYLYKKKIDTDFNFYPNLLQRCDNEIYSVHNDID